MKKRALFLDRDGVLNYSIVRKGKPYSPLDMKTFIIKKTIKKKINFLHKYFKIIVITNQPEVSRGNLSIKTLKYQNQIIKNYFGINNFYICLHDTTKDCNCIKPKTGLFLRARKKFNINFSKSYMIGDRFKDIIPANKLGIKAIFLDYKYKEEKPKKFLKKCKSIHEALLYVINNFSQNEEIAKD